MTEEVVDEISDESIEKEAREYSQEYITELISAAKEYLPKTVWDHIHRKAVPKAGGKASGKSRAAARAAASTEAQNAESAGAVTQPPEVEAQLEQARTQKAETETEKADDCEKVMQKCKDMKKTAPEETEKAEKEEVMKPYPSEHACRLKQPGDFEANSFRRMERDHEGKKYSIITGRLTGESTMTEQAYRYPKDTWDAAAAKAHCSAHKGASFEAAVAKEVKTLEEDIPEWAGPLKKAKVLFIAASLSPYEAVRKSALVGPAGRIFNEQYLKPLGLTRKDVAITYLVPKLLKNEEGKIREPNVEEITTWAPKVNDARREAPSGSITVALGHLVKSQLGHEIDITLPHPTTILYNQSRPMEELERKLHQLERMLKARSKKR